MTDKNTFPLDVVELAKLYAAKAGSSDIAEGAIVLAIMADRASQPGTKAPAKNANDGDCDSQSSMKPDNAT